MPIDWQAIADAGGIGKGRPSALLRDDRRKKRVSLDERESEKVKARSGGQCEIRVIGEGRCLRKAVHVHHQIGGWGSRARGPSVLSRHKQHACTRCHDDITGRVGGKKLVRIGGEVPLWTDRYRRVK